MAAKWTHVEKTVRTSSLRYGHPIRGMDKNRTVPAKYRNQPLDVVGNTVSDGNKRLHDARQRGQKTIKVRVFKRIR